jgi:hypothetical protein
MIASPGFKQMKIGAAASPSWPEVLRLVARPRLASMQFRYLVIGNDRSALASYRSIHGLAHRSDRAEGPGKASGLVYLLPRSGQPRASARKLSFFLLHNYIGLYQNLGPPKIMGPVRPHGPHSYGPGPGQNTSRIR